MQQVIIDGVTQVLQEFLEQEVTTKLGRPKRSPRRMSSQARPIDWQCACCGCSDANQFTRDGHYRRSLETGWGTWMCCECPCWNANAISTMWWHSLLSWRSISASGWMHPIAPSLAVACRAVYGNERPGMGSHGGSKRGIAHHQ